MTDEERRNQFLRRAEKFEKARKWREYLKRRQAYEEAVARWQNFYDRVKTPDVKEAAREHLNRAKQRLSEITWE